MQQEAAQQVHTATECLPMNRAMHERKNVAQDLGSRLQPFLYHAGSWLVQRRSCSQVWQPVGCLFKGSNMLQMAHLDCFVIFAIVVIPFHCPGALPRLETLLHPHDGFNRYSEEGSAVFKVIGKLHEWQKQQKQAAMSAMLAKEAALLQQLGRVGSVPLPGYRPSSSGSVGADGWEGRRSASSNSLH
jgi:hypothetical protein